MAVQTAQLHGFVEVRVCLRNHNAGSQSVVRERAGARRRGLRRVPRVAHTAHVSTQEAPTLALLRGGARARTHRDAGTATLPALVLDVSEAVALPDRSIACGRRRGTLAHDLPWCVWFKRDRQQQTEKVSGFVPASMCSLSTSPCPGHLCPGSRSERSLARCQVGSETTRSRKTDGDTHWMSETAITRNRSGRMSLLPLGRTGLRCSRCQSRCAGCCRWHGPWPC